MKTVIGDLMLLSLASGPVFAASSPFHLGTVAGFDHQPTQQDLPAAVLRGEGHVMQSEWDFDKSLQICRPY
jgi:hypothetical protein